MAAADTTPRDRWIEQGLMALASGGPDAVRIELLARSLGVTKGGFYWHFKDRGALLGEILDTWEHLGVDEVIGRVEGAGGDAREKLWRLFTLATSGSIGGYRGSDILEIDLAVRDWARRDKAVGRRLRRVDNRRMDYMRSLFSDFCPDEEEVETRCLVAFSVWIGNHFIAADHGRRSRDDVVGLVMRGLLA